ncbi:MAG: hypothetical protein JW850_18565 [Thermoflexales bacterium]|nr:hypothetical protein [Thermoflexales bacterium]
MLRPKLTWCVFLLLWAAGLLAVGLSWPAPVTVSSAALTPGDAIPARLGHLAPPTGTAVYSFCAYLPFISTSPDVCAPIEGATYDSLQVRDWVSATRPVEEHGDVNLALRSYTPTQAFLGLVDIGGDTDPRAPQLAGLFEPARLPTFTAAYRVHNWEWGCNCRGDPIDDWDVTLIDVAASPGGPVHVPDSGYTIGQGYEVLVLYATPERLTLKYTGEDNVIEGYTLHLEGVCTDPNLLALYQALDNAGRHELPALRPGQALGRARGAQFGVAIRDAGAFLDPRSRKDWWHGY